MAMATAHGMNGAKDDGRAFVLIKPVCQDSGDGSCQAWKDGGNDEWLFVTLRYKYQTVFVTPKVEAVESIEDTGGLSSDASAVIASPRLLFILDGGSLLNVTFGDRHGLVTSVVSCRQCSRAPTLQPDLSSSPRDLSSGTSSTTGPLSSILLKEALFTSR